MRAFWYNLLGNEHKGTGTNSWCPNPNCIRCQRYAQVQQRAQRRLAWILKDERKDDGVTGNSNEINRVLQAVRLGPRMQKEEKEGRHNAAVQYPSVLLIRGLVTKPIVTEYHAHVCTLLKAHIRGIQADLSKLLKRDHDDGSDSSPSPWMPNDTPGWSVLSLLNQGIWNRSNLANVMPTLNRLLSRSQSDDSALSDFTMTDCLFGNMFLSRIESNTTHILPHCGPTNARHRLQLLLLQQEDDENYSSALHITEPTEARKPAAVTMKWNTLDQLFIFDDSLEHAVVPSNNKRTGKGTAHIPTANTITSTTTSRITLIVDLWHPELSAKERRLIQELYPPYSK